MNIKDLSVQQFPIQELKQALFNKEQFHSVEKQIKNIYCAMLQQENCEELIEHILSSQVHLELINYLNHYLRENTNEKHSDDFYEMLTESLWILANLCLIDEYIEEMVRSGVIELTERVLLLINYPHIVSITLWLIANLNGDENYEIKLRYLESEVLKTFYEKYYLEHLQFDEENGKNLTLALSSILNKIHQIQLEETQKEVTEYLGAYLPIIEKMLQMTGDNEEMITNIYCILSSLIQFNICFEKEIDKMLSCHFHTTTSEFEKCKIIEIYGNLVYDQNFKFQSFQENFEIVSFLLNSLKKGISKDEQMNEYLDKCGLILSKTFTEITREQIDDFLIAHPIFFSDLESIININYTHSIIQSLISVLFYFLNKCSSKSFEVLCKSNFFMNYTEKLSTSPLKEHIMPELQEAHAKVIKSFVDKFKEMFHTLSVSKTEKLRILNDSLILMEKYENLICQLDSMMAAEELAKFSIH